MGFQNYQGWNLIDIFQSFNYYQLYVNVKVTVIVYIIVVSARRRTCVTFSSAFYGT